MSRELKKRRTLALSRELKKRIALALSRELKKKRGILCPVSYITGR